MLFRYLLILIVSGFTGLSFAQDSVSAKASKSRSEGVFETKGILNITIGGPQLRKLLNDRNVESQYYPVTLSYKEKDSSLYTIAMKAKTRGHFRKMSENCSQPPIMLNFPKNDTVKQSIFRKMDKLKLVTTCRKGDYVAREFLVYKMFELLTDRCFKTRLVNVQFEGEKLRKADMVPFLGFLIEDEEELAKRLNARLEDSLLLAPQQTQLDTYLVNVVFEYMIGNVDWSMMHRHNFKTLVPDDGGTPFVIAYDFDHSGIVDAPYANPPEELGMSSVRERRFRGYCISDMSVYDKVLKRFNELKPAFYKIYEESDLVDEAYKKQTFKFLDEFYATINNPKQLASEFGFPCTNSGAKISIGGMKVQQ